MEYGHLGGDVRRSEVLVQLFNNSCGPRRYDRLLASVEEAIGRFDEARTGRRGQFAITWFQSTRRAMPEVSALARS